MKNTKITRRQARLRYKRSSRILTLGGIALAPLFIAVFAYASFAEETAKSKGGFAEKATGDYSIYSLYNGNTPLSFEYSMSSIMTSPIALSDSTNYLLVEDGLSELNETSDKEAVSCASTDGLGGIQIQKMEDEKKLAMASIDMDKMFSLKDNGCFSALSNFPDMSVAIPSLSSIFSAIQQTLKDYATRKVCNAVNDTLEEALGPMITQLDKLSDSGQLDLTGTVNKTLSKKFYEVDPELGRVSQPVGSEKEISFGWDK